MVTPRDPLYSSQWHFSLIGNIERVWSEFTGTGIWVGVYDDGVEARHQDLAPNYDASRHVRDPNGRPVSPLPIADSDAHGTACAGIIGAANNGIGGVGVSYGVKITGVNIDFENTGLYGSINGGNNAAFVDILSQAARLYDVMSNSWGSTPSFTAANGLQGDAFAQQVEGAFSTVSAEGRNSLGTVIVQAAGNDTLDANGDGLSSSRHTICVAATERDGYAAVYSNFGASILVTAPAAAVTTDRSGAAGYVAGNYTTGFNGTSAAAPVVSGVVSLMLDSNAGLGWRDVQNILAQSATGTGSFGGRAGQHEVGTWFVNSADNWNGGGNHIHASYGFGMVNAFNAVRMAEVWTHFAPAQTSANEVRVTSGLNDFPDAVVPEGAGRSFATTFTIAGAVRIEHVALTLDFEAQNVSNLYVTLTSAEGTTIVVANAGGMVTEAREANWVFGVDQLRGELSAGTWTLNVFDLARGDPITVRSAQLDIYGSANAANDVYHFTDEYVTMISRDASRTVIADNDGGTDWLNMAAVTANITLNLTTGSQFRFGTSPLGTLAGLFENVVTGDGSDALTGNAVANRILGMRGDDTLSGEAGADTLEGGAGNDMYLTDGIDTIIEAVGQGWDTVVSWATLTLADNTESLFLGGTTGLGGTGNGGANYLGGNTGDNVLNGAGGADTLVGGLGNDIYVADASDTITEQAGQGWDSVFVGSSYMLGANLESLFLGGTAALTGTGNDLANMITGNSGDNTLNGAGGADTLVGGLGNDLYVTDSIDTITELAGQGWDNVFAFTNFSLGEHLEGLFLGGSAAINATGNGVANYIAGNSGDNTLNGAGGADTLVGGLGNDLYVADAGDTITELAGQGWDSVFTTITFTLGENLEGLFLGGSAAINATGNGVANYIAGNSGDNTLNGAGGADTLVGGLGNDLYLTDSIDTITELAGQGWDSVVAWTNYILGTHLEGLFLGGGAALNGTGNELANFISGNAGANVLAGLGGNDTLVGGAGADMFVFATSLAGDVDRINDFNVVDDLILLDDAVFAGLSAGGGLAAAAFVSNLTGNAEDANDRIIYESDTGNLYFDRDGTGAAGRIHFGTIGQNLAVTQADFFVY